MQATTTQWIPGGPFLVFTTHVTWCVRTEGSTKLKSSAKFATNSAGSIDTIEDLLMPGASALLEKRDTPSDIRI